MGASSIDESSPLARRYLAYFAERFPLPGAAVYALALVSPPLSLGVVHDATAAFHTGDALALFLLAFLVLLHLRVLDEHKDFQKDRVAYPQRLLSRGVVTLGELRLLLYLSLSLELALALFLGIIPVLLWLGVLGWSLLMYVEFFARSFLNRHQLLYLLTHQLLVPLLVLLGVTVGSPDLFSAARAELLLLLLGVMAATVTYELARKTWSADREDQHADSYTRAWGRARAVAAGMFSATLCWAFLGGLGWRLGLAWPLAALQGFLLLLVLGSELAFSFRPSRRNSKVLELAGAIYMLGMLISTSVGLALS